MPTYNLRYIISSVITKGNVLMMFDCKANDAKNYQSVIHGEVRKCRLLETITEMLRWILRYGREGCTYIPTSPDIENDNASIDRIIYLHTENTTFAIYNVLHDIAHYIKFLLTQVRSKWGTNGTWRSFFVLSNVFSKTDQLIKHPPLLCWDYLPKKGRAKRE